jgi:hypothetical protein
MLDVIGPDGDIWYRIDVPILGTICDCEPTEFGWRGIMPNDSVLEVRSDHPGVHAQIPEHHLRWFSNSELMGAYLIERRRRKRARGPSCSRCSAGRPA